MALLASHADRAKIARMRAAQMRDRGQRDASLADYRGYVNLAKRASQSTLRGIVITRG